MLETVGEKLIKLDGRLEYWERSQVSKEEFIIWGNLYDDPSRRWRDGQRIHTSGIRKCGVLKEGDIVHTRNSVYKLGLPKKDPVFKKYSGTLAGS